MNGHPIARMNTILRQVEAPVKYMGSRWGPASNYSGYMFVYSRPMVQYEKQKNKKRENGMNEHPIARMDTLLRQGESPVKIYSSR